MDRFILRQAGGFQTRTELIHEAVESLVTELSYPPAPPEPPQAVHGIDYHEAGGSVDSGSESKSSQREPRVGFSLSDTRLTVCDSCVTVPMPTSGVPDDPLFGLHNRDYPALWVGSLLSHVTHQGLVELNDFVTRLKEEAWKYAEALGDLETRTSGKLTVMFPTNRAKPQSAEDGFIAFAFGTVKHDNGDLEMRGPLYQWKICNALVHDSCLRVGLTEEGVSLIKQLRGMTAEIPHEEGHARVFSEYIRSHAPQDWLCLSRLLREVADEPNRQELVERLRAHYRSWGDNQAATNTAGYVSRGREWGFMALKQREGRYVLTDFGREMIDE